MKVNDRQRYEYNKLVKSTIPKLLEDSSTEFNDRYEVTFSQYPIDSQNNCEEDGTIFTMVKAFTHLRDKVTGEEQDILVDIIKLPIYLDLGFKIAGNYKQVLDLYDRPLGWSYTFKETQSDTEIKGTLRCARHKTFSFASKGKMPYFEFNRKTTKSRQDIQKVSISTFFRALTGMSNQALLEMFGADNPYNLMNFTDNTSTFVEIKSKGVESVSSREECIKALHTCIYGLERTKNARNAHTLLNQLNNWFFNKNYLELGAGNKSRFIRMQSFAARAVNKVLAEDVVLQNKVIPAGTILTIDLLEEIDNSLVDTIYVSYNSKVHSLHKYSSYTFRALNCILAEDIDSDDVHLSAGTKLTLANIRALNDTSLESIKVRINENDTNTTTLVRRLTADTLCIEDLYAAYSIFANDLNGYDFYSDQFELTDRIIIPFHVKAIEAIQENLQIILDNFEGKFNIIKGSDGVGASVTNAITDFSSKIDKDILIAMLKDVNNTESQLSDYNNTLSLAAKGSKITNNLGNATVQADLVSVHGSQFGRLDPYDAPESSKIGLVNEKTLLTEEDEFGYLVTPYYVVVNGELTGEVVKLNANEDRESYIAEWCETFKNEDGTPKKRVNALYHGEVVTVDVTNVHLKQFSQLQNMAATTASIPFCNFSAGKRLQMADNQGKQAVPIIGAERPLVCTGIESMLDVGVYKASEVLEGFYNEQVYLNKDLEKEKDEILHSDLILQSIDEGLSTRVLKLHVVFCDTHNCCYQDYVELSIPVFKQTVNNDMFSYRINPKVNNVYHCDDVIAYSSDYDIRQYDKELLVNYGGVDVDEHSFDGSMALGHNFLVGFKSYGGSSIDDGIVINKKLVSDDTLTSIFIKKETAELSSSDSRSEEFAAPVGSDNMPITNFCTNGLPLVGTHLSPGDCVIYKKVTTYSFDKEQVVRVKYVPTRLNTYTEGQVISAEIYEKMGKTIAEVLVATRASAEVGDKLAGRYGNKGVIAKIVPEEEMPYDPVSGKSLDILLNPLGIPSRMNISQLYEVGLGAAEHKENKISIVSPFHPDSCKFVEEKMQEAGIHPIRLIDGKTGQFFERPINVGYQYLEKLVHMVRKKIHAVGFDHGVNSVTLQAKSSAKMNGGQAFGEMESWCLESIGANKVLQEIQTVLADDRDKRADIMQQIEENPYDIDVTGDSHNAITMQALWRSLGAEIELESDENGINCYAFKPLTDRVIKQFSPIDVTPDSLHSNTIFGNNDGIANKMLNRDKWGWINLHTEIVSPLWLERGNLSQLFLVKGKKSYKVCNKSDLYKIAMGSLLVRKPIGVMDSLDLVSCDKVPQDELEHFMWGFDAITYIFKNYDLKGSLAHLETKLSKSTKNVEPIFTAEDAKHYQLTGEYRATGIPEDVEPDEIVNSENVYDFVFKNSKKLELRDVYTFVKDFIDRGAKLSDYLVSTYPVMPAVYRLPTRIAGSTKEQKSDFDVHYTKILSAAAMVAQNESEENRLAVYNAIRDFIGIDSNKKQKYVTVLQWFMGKGSNSHGKVRETVQKKVVARSGRSVIIPAQDTSMSPMNVGVPIHMAVAMYEEQLIQHLLRYATNTNSDVHIGTGVWREFLQALVSGSDSKVEKLYRDKFSSLYKLPVFGIKTVFIKWIKYFVEGTDGLPLGPNETVLPPRVVLCGRQPSLHRYSVRGYYAKIVFTKAMQMHPLVCKGYNADFDGDQMWLIALLTKDAQDEAIELMSPKCDIINPKSGDIILAHSQDISLGIYCSTMLKDNTLDPKDYLSSDVMQDVLFYDSIDSLRSDVYGRVIHAYDLVCLNLNDKKFLSTAGRILFNSLVPGGLSGDREYSNVLGLDVNAERFADLQYDGLITSGSPSSKTSSYKLSKICMSIYEESLQDPSIDLLKVYGAISEFGFTMAELFGVSISLDDLKDITRKSGKKELLEEAEDLKSQYERDYQRGLLVMEDKVTSVHNVYDDTLATVQDRVFGNEPKGIIGSMSRNNNIFIMFDSGARGSKGQIMQTVGVLGSLQKNKTDNLPNPITTSYSEGLSSFDFLMMSYSTRTGMASTQNETSAAGYATRQAIHCVAGLNIIEYDCGKTDWWFDVRYDSKKPLKQLDLFKPNYEFFKEELLGKELDLTDSETSSLFGNNRVSSVITEEDFDILSKGLHSIVIKDKDRKNIISAGLDGLVGAKPIDDSVKKLLKNFLEFDSITPACIPIIQKHCLKVIKTDIGEFQFRYAMDAMCKSLLKYREARNLPYLEEYKGAHSKALVTPMYVITDKTLKYVEESGLDRIEARILLDCKTGRDESKHKGSVAGCCSRCYGLRYSNKTLPQIGDNIGIETAQAIGEPAAQLTLSLVNKGGSAGESIASGVDILHRLLNGSSIKANSAGTDALVTRESGYLSVEKVNRNALLQLTKEDGTLLATKDALTDITMSTKIPYNLLICKNGEWVDAGSPVTAGYVMPDSIYKIPEKSTDKLIRYKQMVWCHNWYRNFIDNNIEVMARHFEVFARAQMSDVYIVKSDDSRFVEGKKYKYAEVVDVPGVIYTLNVNSIMETVISNSGALTAISFENLPSVLPSLVFNEHRSYSNADIGAINVGENLFSRKKVDLHSTPATSFVKQSEQQNMFTPAEFDFKQEKIEVATIDFGSLDELNLFGDTGLDTGDTDIIDDLNNTDNLDVVNHAETLKTVMKSFYSDEYVPIADLLVLLKNGNTVISTSTTNESGECSFTDLNAGHYVMACSDERLESDFNSEIVINNDDVLVHLDTSYLTLKTDTNTDTDVEKHLPDTLVKLGAFD